MYQKQILMEKLKEATASVLPISLIVMAISFVLVPVDAGLMLSFVIATAMLILGMGLFTLGADMSMSRIGNYMGSKLTKSRKLPLILTVSFALGVAITVAEPDLQVLAGNVPEIDTTVLILTVSVGVGFFLMLCMVRILFSISLRTMLIVFYAIVFAAAFLSDESILSVAFDSGGVTTGPMTVPFIMALGVGVASIRSDENAKADSFGLVGLCSIGPILSVLLLGAIYKTQPAQGESSAVSGVATTVELGKDYLHALPEYLWEVTMALLPIVVFFLIFQVISLKLRKLPFMRIVIGILYTYLGLVLFLTGVNVGFSPLGYALGAALAEGWKVYLLAPLAMLMGWFIINAEPAVHTLNKQVEELSAGAISAKAMGMSLSIAVSAAGGLAMLRVITGISIMYFLVPGYLIALALSFFRAAHVHGHRVRLRRRRVRSFDGDIHAAVRHRRVRSTRRQCDDGRVRPCRARRDDAAHHRAGDGSHLCRQIPSCFAGAPAPRLWRQRDHRTVGGLLTWNSITSLPSRITTAAKRWARSTTRRGCTSF